jgi:transcriptional regulator with XRE-family HTH domain
LTIVEQFEKIGIGKRGNAIMASEKKNQSLGEFVRGRRHSLKLSLADAAQVSGFHLSYWSYLEAGKYNTPSPKHLQVIARVLGVPFEDLYGLAGYDSPTRLPAFTPYLRAKYELPPEAIADLEKYFAQLRAYYGIPDDQPVFPPTTKVDDSQADEEPKIKSDQSPRRIP